MMSRQPWIYHLLYQIACSFPLAAPATRLLLRPLRGRLLRWLPSDVVAVVSTFPLGTQILGPLRRSGHLAVPAISYLTDFAVHPICVADGIDMHCAPHEVSRGQAAGLGARDIRVVGRVVCPRFQPAAGNARAATRRRLGLPAGERLALLVAGSWGVGSVEKAVVEVMRARVATPVVVCGGNAKLYRKLRRQGLNHVFSWVDDMASLMQAVDVLVENAGGLTALEAMASGVPVLTYRPIVGHGIANAAAMARAGVSRWARSAADLSPTLLELTDRGQGMEQRSAALTLFDSDPATAIAELAKAGAGRRPGGEAGRAGR